MTARFHCSRPRQERLARLPSPPRIHRAGHGGQGPSERLGARWKALPVEGSKAWAAQQPKLRRIFFTR
jgi:hypothetical protein